MNKILGLDLAAKEKNPTGYVYYDKRLFSGIIKKDREIYELIEKVKPELISIDAPLSLEEKPFRESERELIKRGFRPLPLSIKSMEELAKRAIKIKDSAESKSIEVIETFPRAVEKILGYNFNNFKRYFKSKHIYDAWLCYLAGLFYKINEYDNLKGIILPKLMSKK